MELENRVIRNLISSELEKINFLLDLINSNKTLSLSLINTFISSFEFKNSQSDMEEFNKMLLELQLILNDNNKAEQKLIELKSSFKNLEKKLNKKSLVNSLNKLRSKQTEIFNIELKLYSYTPKLLNKVNKNILSLTLNVSQTQRNTIKSNSQRSYQLYKNILEPEINNSYSTSEDSYKKITNPINSITSDSFNTTAKQFTPQIFNTKTVANASSDYKSNNILELPKIDTPVAPLNNNMFTNNSKPYLSCISYSSNNIFSAAPTSLHSDTNSETETLAVTISKEETSSSSTNNAEEIIENLVNNCSINTDTSSENTIATEDSTSIKIENDEIKIEFSEKDKTNVEIENNTETEIENENISETIEEKQVTNASSPTTIDITSETATESIKESSNTSEDSTTETTIEETNIEVVDNVTENTTIEEKTDNIENIPIEKETLPKEITEHLPDSIKEATLEEPINVTQAIIKREVPEKKKKDNFISINKKNFYTETLVISETSGTVTLPYTDEIIDLYYYRNPSLSRFREAFHLARTREFASLTESIKLGFDMMFRSDIHPAIITACRSTDDLYTYISYLEDGNVENFPLFKIKFEIHPF